jgi:DDE superfamily endonuclease
VEQIACLGEGKAVALQFPLHEHVLKNFDVFARETRQEASKREVNRRLTNCRRLSEMAFGRLKGRWTICARNHTYYSPDLCRDMTEAYCGLHNFLEGKKRDTPVCDQHVPAAAPVPWGDPASRVGMNDKGAQKRELLRQWTSENM